MKNLIYSKTNQWIPPTNIILQYLHLMKLYNSVQFYNFNKIDCETYLLMNNKESIQNNDVVIIDVEYSFLQLYSI